MTYAGLRVIEQNIAASMLDIATKLRRAVDAAFLAHEGDGTVAVDDETADLRDSRPKTFFHRRSPACVMEHKN